MSFFSTRGCLERDKHRQGWFSCAQRRHSLSGGGRQELQPAALRKDPGLLLDWGERDPGQPLLTRRGPSAFCPVSRQGGQPPHQLRYARLSPAVPPPSWQLDLLLFPRRHSKLKRGSGPELSACVVSGAEELGNRSGLSGLAGGGREGREREGRLKQHQQGCASGLWPPLSFLEALASFLSPSADTLLQPMPLSARPGQLSPPPSRSFPPPMT